MVRRARMSMDDDPTSNSNSPASTSQSWDTTSHTANARRSSRMVTFCDSPGASATFAKALSSFAGRYTVDSTSLTYTCTTSLPARLPVLVTVTVTV